MLMRSCSDISRRCRHTMTSNMMKMMANTQRRCCHVAAPTRHDGKIIAWNPIDRRGRIQDNTTGREFIIANTRAFESVLPTTLRSLNGASVSFAVDTRAHAGDRVIVRSRVDPIHAASYTQRPPMDFLRCVEPFAPRKQQQQEQRTSSSTNATQAEPEKHDDVDELYAKDIVIDVSSISNDQLVHASGPHVHQQPIAPPKHLKDLRSCRVLDAETNEFLLMRRQLGSDEAARAAMERQREEKARNAHVREVVMEKVRGVVVAWSPIHRSGVISIKAEDVDGTTNDNNNNNNTNNNDLSTTSMEGDHLCIIRHVQSFSSAMPTSNALLHREVSFTKVRYTLPHSTDASSSSSTRFFAEDIVLSGDVTFDASTSSAEEAHQLKMTEQREERARRSLGANFFADAVDDARFLGAEDVVPDDGLVGVITRWSGGQGTIESSGGKLFYIRSAADFVELVDAQSSSIRGAVVRFYPHDDDRRHAHTIDIISHASFKPSSSSSASITWMGKYNNVSIKKRLMDEDRARTSTSKDDDDDDDDAAHTEEADVKYDYGMLLSWSAVEGQGIIHGEDGQRFVLRDASRHVVDFERRKGAMCNGRKVQFVRDGASGKLATRVVVLESEAEEEERVAEELQPRNNNNNNMSLDGHTDEAIASPECASYWISRAEKSGFDLSEVKALQNRALTMDDGAEVGSDGEDKLLDSEDIIKKDHWWSDPRKNIRFPNSDFTAGHLALVGPASMMNVAMKAKDPQRLDKMAKKYQAKLTEAQREKAWAMAKEMAPKYEDCIKRARDKNEEPSFYFY